MIRKLSSLFLLASLIGPVGAVAPPTDAEIEYGRKKYDVWRQFPDRFASLRQAAETFAALPRPRQEQLEQLDADLAKESSATQAKLHDVLDRYNEWLARLPDKDRERVVQAPDKAARLAVVKELRQADWLAIQPKATRDGFNALPADLRPKAIDRARAEDRKKQAEWAIAKKFWDETSKNRQPSKLADLDFNVQNYVTDVLMRLLSKEERDRLAAAEGHWPLYPQTLVELADAHPPALPSPEGPKTFADLPKMVRDSIRRPQVAKAAFGIEKRIKPFEGRSPDFAMKLTALAKENNWIMPLEWWAYSVDALTPAGQEFLEKTLIPTLDLKEQHLYVDSIGKWPDFPEAIQKLAKIHNLRVPWQSLPGGREKWDVYRSGPHALVPGFPELPKYKLREFVFYDLDDLGRTKLNNEIDRARLKNDGEVWPYVVEQYFRRYPGELARLRQADRETQRPGKNP